MRDHRRWRGRAAGETTCTGSRGEQQDRGVRVPQIMKPDHRHGVVAERGRHRSVSRSNWRETCSRVAVLTLDRRRTRARRLRQLQRHAAALGLQRPQHGHGVRVEVDHPRLAALGVALDDLGALAGVRGPCPPTGGRRPCPLEVDVAPAQRQGLAAAHPGHGQQVPERRSSAACASAHPRNAASCAGVHGCISGAFASLRARRRRRVGRVAQQQPVPHGLAEHAVNDRVQVADRPRRQALARPVVLPAGLLEHAGNAR